MSLQPQKTIQVPLETFRVAPADSLDASVQATIERTQRYLLSQQKPEGYWVGELIVDSTLVSDVVAFMHWTGEVDFNKQSRCVKHLLDRQHARRRLEHLLQGPERTQRHGEGLLRAEAGRFFAGRPADAQGPRDHRAPRRHSQGEHLHEAFPRHVRPVSVEVSADHSVGDHPAAELALF